MIDKAEIKRLFITWTIIYIVLFLPTCFIWHFDKYTAWIISLVSKDLRLLLIPIGYYKLFGIDSFFALLFLFIGTNIPTDFADIYTIDLLDRMLYVPKIAFAFFLSVEIYKYKREQNEKRTK